MLLTATTLYRTVRDARDLDSHMLRPRPDYLLRGLRERHAPKVVTEILRFEDMYDDYVSHGSVEFEYAVHKCIHTFVSDAEQYAKDKRINVPDDEFYEELFKITWKTVEKYNEGDSKYFLREQIKRACISKRIDVIRKWTAKKRCTFTIEYSLDDVLIDGDRAVTLMDVVTVDYTLDFNRSFAIGANPVQVITLDDLMQRMLAHESLTDDERKLLRYLYGILYHYPFKKRKRGKRDNVQWGPSYQRIADDLGLGHKQKAKRLHDSLARKLEPYKMYLRWPYTE